MSIHKRTCVNVPEDLSTASEPERWVKARWASQVNESFKSTLEMVAEERSGLLMDVTQQIFNMHLQLHSLNSRECKDGTAIIYANITVNGPEHLQGVMQKLKTVSGMISVKRAGDKNAD